MPTSLAEIVLCTNPGPRSQRDRGRETAAGRQVECSGWEVLQDIPYRTQPIKGLGLKYQLVVPRELTNAFLHYFHSNPLGAPLSRLKTLLRILEVAWWQHVQRYKPGFYIRQKLRKLAICWDYTLWDHFQSKRDNSYMPLVVDYFGKWNCKEMV